MPQYSEALKKLKASSTVAFNTKANEMKRNGIDVIAMTAGEPDFQPPEHVLAAANEAIDKGMTKYTAPAGTADLREAVVGKFERENNLSYDPKQVSVSTGGKQVLYNANPTGAVYPKELIKAVVEMAAAKDIWIFTDDLYEHLVYDGEFTPAAQYAQDKTLIIHGASKAYALTGWRIGYGVGPAELISAMNRLQGQVTSGANSVAQHAVTVALNEVDKTHAFIEMTKKAYIERRNTLVAGLNNLGLTTPMPSGAFYVMTDLTSIDSDENVAAVRLLEEAHVGMVPGTDFLAPGKARLSYATSLENIEKALDRIEKFLKA